MKINQDERVSFTKWIEYNDYHNIHELCDDFQFELKHIHDYSDYIVNGQHCALKFPIMNKIKLFISWMSTTKKENTFQHSSQYLLSLTYQGFNKFRQEDMIRMAKVPTTQIPSITNPFLSHTWSSKIRPVFLSQPVDIFDEPNCDSTEPILVDKDEPDPSSSPTVKSASNLHRTKRTFTRVHFTFPEDSTKLIIEEHKDVKVFPPTKHSTIGNHQPIPQPKPIHSPDICPSPEKPSQDVDNSDLSNSTSTTRSLNETCFLDTSGDHLLYLDSPSLSSELQNASRVESVEPEPVPDSEDLLQLVYQCLISGHIQQ